MIILNEKEYAEECLKNETIDKKPFITLSILAKYYYHHLGYRKKKITESLTYYMEKCCESYSINKLSWDDTIENITANAGKYELFEIDGVWITESELATIDSIKDKVLERLAFTMLCLAKFKNIRNSQNNGWVNTNTKEIFKLARISCNVEARFHYINKLVNLGLLEYPKRNDNLNNRVTFIDDNSERILCISDFRELGYEYLKFKGGRFTRCQDCGILIRNSKFGTRKYCSACAAYTPLETKINICVDCGKGFEIDSKNNKSCRCDDCYDIYRRKYYRENKRKQRKILEMSTEQI